MQNEYKLSLEELNNCLGTAHETAMNIFKVTNDKDKFIWLQWVINHSQCLPNARHFTYILSPISQMNKLKLIGFIGLAQGYI